MEKYEKPSMEVVELNGENVICSSSCCGNCGFADYDGHSGGGPGGMCLIYG